MHIYKILREAEYHALLKDKIFAGAPIDLQDGYIHFSTRETVEETANIHFKEEDDLYILICHSEQFGSSLKWEESRGGQEFPHLYGSLHIDHVISAEKLPKRDGQFDFEGLL